MFASFRCCVLLQDEFWKFFTSWTGGDTSLKVASASTIKIRALELVHKFLEAQASKEQKKKSEAAD